MADSVQNILKYLKRANAAFLKGETLRPMVSVAEALKLILSSKLHSMDQQKVTSLLRESLQNLSKLEAVKQFRAEPLALGKGGEKQVLAQLVPLIKKIHAERKRESMEAVRERKLNIDRAIIHGRNALAGGKVDEAREYFRQATNLHVDEDAMYLIIADALHQAEAFKESFEYLRLALMQNPGDRKACEMLVEACKKTGKAERGMLLLKKIQEKKEQTAQAGLALAKLLAQKRQYKEAEGQAQASLALDPELLDAKKFLRSVQSKAAKA
ncbi:hypothetical protein [Desulfocurvus sp. DL9XJH121]